MASKHTIALFFNRCCFITMSVALCVIVLIGCENSEIIADFSDIDLPDEEPEALADESTGNDSKKNPGEDLDTSDPTSEHFTICDNTDVLNARDGRDGSFEASNQGEINSLMGVTLINGDLTIDDSMDDDIFDLSPLANLTCVIGDLVIENSDHLRYIAGAMPVLMLIDGKLTIANNKYLPTCSATSFYDSIKGREGGRVEDGVCIKDNSYDQCAEANEYKSDCDDDFH